MELRRRGTLTDAGIALRDGGGGGGGGEEEGEEEEAQNDDEDDGGEEDEEEEQATSTQLKLVLGSVRWHIHRALCAGISERSDIVQHVVSKSARPLHLSPSIVPPNLLRLF